MMNVPRERFTSDIQKQLGELPEETDSANHKMLNKAVKALDAFFHDGAALPMDFPVKPQGTDFQKRVWQALQEIPSGKFVTYGLIARKIGSPNASRAVGAACGANPVPLFIPCHRVVGADGSLIGFGGGGVEVKTKLLELEAVK
ncbi:methylated-DNA--[protein]-cysteine S-methyltransferase [bacterium]|nr:methylated-DNA--[protein]-cysteine S-methyltransferase [bacterium]MBU1881129.1 methylated-DNA--[protein]-cysteine S-methyltransferase [bacterium]